MAPSQAELSGLNFLLPAVGRHWRNPAGPVHSRSPIRHMVARSVLRTGAPSFIMLCVHVTSVSAEMVFPTEDWSLPTDG